METAVNKTGECQLTTLLHVERQLTGDRTIHVRHHSLCLTREIEVDCLLELLNWSVKVTY